MVNYKYQDCIVSFIDILGFKNIVEDESVEKIVTILNRMKSFKPEENAYPADHSGSKPYGFTMSDAIVRILPLDFKYRDGALAWELYELLLAQIELLELGVLIRGGVTIGKAYIGKNGDGPIFGPGIIRAYEIENKKATFPRIVLDNNVIKNFKENERLRSQDNSFEVELKIIKRFIKTDDKEVNFIDYLSDRHVGEYNSEYSDYYTFLQNHANLIRENLEKYKNTKPEVYKKYEWLASYHEETIAPQRINAKEDDVKTFLNKEFDVDSEAFFEEITIKL